MVAEVEAASADELSVIDEEPEYSENGDASEPEYDKTLFRPAHEVGGFSEAEVERISQEQAAIGLHRMWSKEEEMGELPEYLVRLYEDVEDLEHQLHTVKKLLHQDLKTYIENEGRGARPYVYHFANDLKGIHDFQCMFCFQFLGSHSAKNNHISAKHRNEKPKTRTNVVMVPRLKKRHHLCIVCGFVGRSQEDVLLHIDTDHDFEQQKRFGLV